MSGRTSFRWTAGLVRPGALVAVLCLGQVIGLVDEARAFPIDWDVEFVNYLEPPTAGELMIENRSNGNYRVTLPATPHTRWDMAVTYLRIDPTYDEPIEVDATAHYALPETPLRGFASGLTGTLEMTANSQGIVGPLPGENVTVDIDVRHGAEQSIDQTTAQITAPLIDPHLEWSFDVNSDGTFELVRADQNYIDFKVLPGQANVMVSATVFGAGADETFNGQLRPLQVTVTENFVIDNQPPSIQNMQILSAADETREVVVSFSGVDADGDNVSFTVDWGDGSSTESVGPVATHVYGVHDTYTITVEPKDWTSSGGAESTVVNLVAPAPNAEPSFEYAQVISQVGFSVLVAASAVDADGDTLTYEFAWGDGSQSTISPGVIQGHDYPDGVYDTYTVDIIVTDGRGGEALIKLPVDFVEPPANTAPRINFVHEIERDGFDVTLAVDAVDDENDPLTISVDWQDNGATSTGTSRIIRHTYPDGVYDTYEPTISVTDDQGLTAELAVTIDFPAPQANQAPIIEGIETVEQSAFRSAVFVRASDADGDALTYTVDWGDETVIENSLNPLVVHTYAEAFESYTVRITVTDEHGAQTSTEHVIAFTAPAANQNPVFAHAQVLDQGTFTVIVAASAADPDGDPVRYQIDWGDDTPMTETVSGVAQHQYPSDVFRAYAIEVTAMDGRGGVAQTNLPVVFSEPAPNQPPVIDLAEIVALDGFSVTLAMHAIDPDDDEVTFAVTWGDNTDVVSTAAGLLTHTYPLDVYRPYTIQIIAQDAGGLIDSTQVDVDFPAPPPNVSPVFSHAEIVDRNGFAVVINAEASDADGDTLTYAIDWGDGSNILQTPSATAAHLYQAGLYQPYTITITANDGRGGQAQIDIDHEFVAPPNNRAPTVQLAEVIEQTDFRIGFAVNGLDPDGDSLSYTFDWGDDTQPTVTDGGVAFHDFPVDVYTSYTVLVTIRDGRGGEVVHRFDIDFPAPPDNQAPVFEIAKLVEKSDFEVVVAVAAVDPDGDPLTYQFDWGDESDATIQTNGVAEHTFADGVFRTYTVTITANDGRAGVAVSTIEIDFPAPPQNAPPIIESLVEIHRDNFRVTLAASASDPEGEPLEYRFSWADNSDDTTNSEGLAAHVFPDGVYQPYLVELIVTDPQGGESTSSMIVDFPEPEPNQLPIIEAVRLVKHDEWNVTCAVGAVDPDGDPLSISIDWGDGTDPTVNLDGLAAHTYPVGAYESYTVTVTVSDDRGGRVDATATVDFPPPPPNGLPVIDEVDVVVGARGQVDVVVHAWDPENEALTYAVHWGDEAAAMTTENLPAGTGSHRYALPVQQAPYDGFVLVTDARGGETRAPFAVLIQDAPVNIRQLAIEHIHNGSVRIHVTADDADGNAGLVYDFDVDGDERFEYETVAQSTIVHQYPSAGAYRVIVKVTDTWSGHHATAEQMVDVEQWVADNQSPTISQLHIAHEAGGFVQLRVDGFDPDADQLSYRVHWGDEADNGTDEALLAGFAEHRYAYRVDERPYAGWVDVYDNHGSTSRQSFEIAITDTPSVVDEVDVRDLGDGVVELSIFARDVDAINGLLYSIDFNGDGVLELRDSPVHTMRYQFEQPGTYDLQVEAIDPWSNVRAPRTIRHVVAPWIPENSDPIIDEVQVTQHARGRVIVRISARDPEGEPLGIFVHWGDENQPDTVEPVVGDVMEHRYAFPVNGQVYNGFVRVRDAAGVEVTREFDVVIQDAPTQLSGLSAERVREGSWLLTIRADDPDGMSSLRYAFDFTADGTWDVQDLEVPQLVHTYAAPPPHLVRVGVTDLWSGVMTDGIFPIGDDRVGTPNLPPSLDDVRVTVGARGRVELTVDTSDPESGELSVEIDWGDGSGAETLTGNSARHEYAYPETGEPYLGRVVVTDEAGLSAETSVSISIQDAMTVIREVQTTHLGHGEVLVHVNAYDPDGADLLYQYDMDFDDVPDGDPVAIPEHRFQYEESGEYTFNVIVQDSWSGQSIVQQHAVNVRPWMTRAPIAEDHLQTEEGRCVVFRVRQGQLSTRLDPDICDRTTNPDESLWHWDFGDGQTDKGSEVGHRYIDEGVFIATVSGGTDSRPLASEIQVLVINTPPSFVTRPPTDVVAGQTYEALVRLEDPGANDALQVTMEEGPDGMVITALSQREFQITWEVPQDASGAFNVHLVAVDGHEIENGFEQDGGRASLRFTLDVEALVIPDASVPEPDAGLPSFDEIQGDRLGCDATKPGPSPVPFVALLFCVLIPLIRRLR